MLDAISDWFAIAVIGALRDTPVAPSLGTVDTTIGDKIGMSSPPASVAHTVPVGAPMRWQIVSLPHV